MLDRPTKRKFLKHRARLRNAINKRQRQPMVLYFDHTDHEPSTAVGKLLQQVDEAYQAFMTSKIDPMLGAKRYSLSKELEASVGKQEISPLNKALNRRVAYSLIYAISGTLSSISPLFLLFGLPFALLSMVNLLVLIEDRRQRGLSVFSYPTVVFAGWVLGTLSGQFAVIGFLGLLFNMSYKTKSIVEDRAHNRIVNQFAELPRFVWLWKDGSELEVPLESLEAGDVVVVDAGEVIPADGRLVEGSGAVDQHALTGESQPVEKGVGDEVFASTIVIAGKLFVQVENAGKATVSAQIVDVLNNSYSYHKMIEAKGWEISNTTAPYVLAATAAATVTLGPAVATGVTFVPLGYTTRAAAPLTMLNFLNLAADRSILIKDARSLELLAEVDTFVFDKTGTLTLDQPEVSQVYAFNGHDPDEVLSIAAAAE